MPHPSLQSGPLVELATTAGEYVTVLWSTYRTAMPLRGQGFIALFAEHNRASGGRHISGGLPPFDVGLMMQLIPSGIFLP